MRRLALLTLIWLALLASPAVPADRRVGISVFDYRPRALVLNPGDSVTWRWAGPDTNHSVTSARGQAERFESDPDRVPDAVNHDIGSTFQHTFTEAGVFDYLCRVHPRFMRGSVRVRAVPDHEPPRIRTLRVAAGRLRFTLSERATLSGQIRRIGTPRSQLPVRTLRFGGRRGRNEVRLATRGLRPGRYHLTLRATDPVRNVSRPARSSFAVRRAGKAGHGS